MSYEVSQTRLVKDTTNCKHNGSVEVESTWAQDDGYFRITAYCCDCAETVNTYIPLWNLIGGIPGHKDWKLYQVKPSDKMDELQTKNEELLSELRDLRDRINQIMINQIVA